MHQAQDNAAECPCNGIDGIKHWRHDMLSGFIVSLISMPFSLGIAVASGQPAHHGHHLGHHRRLRAAVSRGVVRDDRRSRGGAGSGPSGRNGHLGTRRSWRKVTRCCWSAIFFAGLVQVLLYVFRLARFAAIFPASVIEGMLCAIGLLIIAKQVPTLLGVKFEAHDFWPILQRDSRPIVAVESRRPSASEPSAWS